MKIHHLHLTTLIDYPDEVASIVFLGGCNLNCGYCYNKPLARSDPKLPVLSTSHVLKTLARRKPYIQAVVVTGGEPTIHVELPELLYCLKIEGFKVKLDTNGTNPKRLSQILNQKLVDYVAMDIKAPLETYHLVAGAPIDTAGLKASMAMLVDDGVQFEFRTTLWKGLFSEPSFRQMVTDFPLLQTAGSRRYYLQNYYPTPYVEGGQYQPLSKHDVAPLLTIAQAMGIQPTLRGTWL
jgi:pyruvate formate lyase activating enzyme